MKIHLACTFSMFAFFYTTFCESYTAFTDKCSENYQCASEAERVCQCDDQCSFFGDCCNGQPRDPSKIDPYEILLRTTQKKTRRVKRQGHLRYPDEEEEYDYEQSPDNTRRSAILNRAGVNSNNVGVFECVESNLLMVSKCSPRMISKSGPVFERCENSESVPDDPYAKIPATDAATNITYKNYYCALCNERGYEGLKFWKMAVHCNGIDNDPNKGSQFADELVYNEEVKSWGIWEPKENMLFYKCTLQPWNDFGIRPRVCVRNLVKSCPNYWTDNTVTKRCHSTGYMPIFGKKNYKNIHCAICNEEDFQNLICTPRSYDYTTKSTVPSFGVLIDVSDTSGDRVGKLLNCPQGQVSFSGKCKTLTCGKAGYTVVNGKCVQT